MSLINPTRRQSIYIGLEPHQITAAMYHGTSLADDSLYQEKFNSQKHSWENGLKALQAYVKQDNILNTHSSVSVALSGSWCRLLMVPWSDSLLRKETAAHFLKSQFIAIYGDDANHWAITVDNAPYGHPRLACAIDHQLLDEIKGTISDAKLHCNAVEPICTLALRAYAQHNSDATVFMLVESDKVSLLLTARGRVQAIYSQSIDESAMDHLEDLWQRWALRHHQLSDVSEVAVINLSGVPIHQKTSSMFSVIDIPPEGLRENFKILACYKNS